jgi:small subunit ribosomal protein S20
MPHTRNAKKRLRQNEKRRLVNRSAVKAIKTQVKKLREVVDAGNLEQAKVEFNLLAKKLDKAAARRIVHPNLAARKKSQCAGWLKKTKPAPAAS